MIRLQDFRLLVVRATLQRLSSAIPYSLAAENLLIGTALHESENLTYLAQVDGPALGFWQMEPATYADIWNNYLQFRPQLRALIYAIAGGDRPDASALVTNLALACAMARVQYARSPAPLPQADDAAGLEALYKTAYNSAAGAATVNNSLGAFQAAIAA